MDNERPGSHNVSRRDAMKTALMVSAYAAPVILSASIPATASAQVSGTFANMTGTITSAATGLPISGAAVTRGGFTAFTNSSGVYTLALAFTGSRIVTVSAANFSTRNDTVVVSGASTTYSTALVPVAAGGGITIVLTWGAQPPDLDSHLTGPIAGGSTRFHTYWNDPAPVPYATLDVDDVDGFGPETITVSPLTPAVQGAVGDLFVAGDYRFYVHNYETTPEFNASPATVAVFQGGVQLATYQASAATGSPASDYWLVFNFTLTASATGAIVITPVQQYADAGVADVLTPMPRKRR